MSYELWILIVGSLVGITCGVTGCFLILRRLSMLADAISHTVLLGIVMSYLISQSMSGVYMLIGASIVGLLTTFFVQLFQSTGIQEDASIGVVFTFLFAIGVILISLFASNVHLDVEHVLMGEISFVPWDVVSWYGFAPMPKAFLMLSIVLIIDLLIIGLFYKELKLTSFDPQLAVVLGIPVMLIHYLLMGMVSITTVASFDSVGAILVVAMLIAPGASSYLLTNRLSIMLLLSALIGMLAAVSGYYASIYFNVSVSGMMAVMNGVIFFLVFLFSPSKGLIAKQLLMRNIAKRNK